MGPVVPTSGTAVQLELGPPFKKIRFGELKPEVQQPLRIDTREQPAYNPQVEAISPTLPPDSMQEDAAFRATKDDLLQQIGKVDREIAKVESQICKLKKKQQELEETANKPSIKKEEEEIAQPKHQSPAQKIYAENRKKAQEAHSLLERLGPKVELPLYNQPSDTAVYHENKRKHLTFKRRLMEYFKRKHSEREGREKYLTATYSKLMQEWLRKVEKVEASQKRKAKEAKNREFFEKVFPELRKQREDRERFNRVGARIKSEADLEEIMDGLQEQEMEDKKMRSYAVIPPILLDARQRRVTYVNNNGRIEDFAGEYNERQLLNVWTATEHDIFKEKYLQHPKNFGVIKTYLDRKSVCDCVQHYYLTKKTENYKQLLRKSRQRTRASRNNPHGKPSSASQNNLADVLSGPTGVTTRLQREQQQKQEQPNSSASNTSNSASATCASAAVTTTAVMSTCNSTSTTTSLITTSNAITSNSSSTSTATSVSAISTASEQSQLSATITTTSTTATITNSTSVTVTTVAPSTVVSSILTVSVTSSSPGSSVSATAIVNVVSSSSLSNSNNNNNNNNNSNNNNNLTPSKDQHLLNDKDGVENETKNNSEGKIENKKKERRKEEKKKKEEVETSDEECVDTQGK
ncbi:hypothetical protein B7P43_G14654 [Cryptotermes secundus]|uniref:SANT domain-containing protein n=1 Tax=Cryptotermes secundus TaxID=105785 RepID=A0A2J7RM83_9NEOP|nr:hypothetical protein B7P43_G14654 [Cryptotermes secundus]